MYPNNYIDVLADSSFQLSCSAHNTYQSHLHLTFYSCHFLCINQNCMLFMYQMLHFSSHIFQWFNCNCATVCFGGVFPVVPIEKRMQWDQVWWKCHTRTMHTSRQMCSQINAYGHILQHRQLHVYYRLRRKNNCSLTTQITRQGEMTYMKEKETNASFRVSR